MKAESIAAKDLPVGGLREAWSEGRSFAATIHALSNVPAAQDDK